MMDSEVTAIVQARSGSTRLRDKVLRELPGGTVLDHVLRRAKALRGVGKVIVATTGLKEDERIVATGARHGVGVTRGSSEDVLSRFVAALDEHGGEICIRITSDCPFLDPELVSEGLREYERCSPDVDYLSNTLTRSFPRGLDFEICSAMALRRAASEATDPLDREHVTRFIYRRPEIFRLVDFHRADPHDSADWRLTLDTEDDWRLIRQICSDLSSDDPLFGLAMIEPYLLANEHLLTWNRHVEQKDA